MSDWREIVENGQVYYVNDEVGNILKTIDGKFIAMLPKVIKFGPFESLEQAKQAFQNKASLEQWLEQYNQGLMQFQLSLKSQ